MRDVDTISGQITFGGFQAPQSRQLRVLRHSNGRLVFEDFLEVRQDLDAPSVDDAGEIDPSADPDAVDGDDAPVEGGGDDAVDDEADDADN